ncbi:4,5-DOPA dioxygenase extradiol [Aquihabitans sp. McL0605]|uniref:4,5-DOPA-extradiol-dioxygenase n=1 Tax=Aquihabitans sp. McL0605 TaxID=3415671 RepID=UPI003CE945B8
MPAAFLGHGNPMNTLADNAYTRSWSAFGAGVPRPRAILVVSAHWYINASAITAMARPRTIHDFFGFPDELFAVEYPAPGSPEIADEVAEAVKPMWVGLDHDSWGLDHGTWSVLVHAFPAADIPVLQLSVDAGKPIEHHLQLGAALAPLREQGILVVGSGNIVHNLGMIDFGLGGQGFDWAHRYDDAAREVLTIDPGAVAKLLEHPDHRRAVPTPDHFLPMVYLAGLAAAAGQPLDVLIDGYDAGSLSMTSYTLGL